MRTIIPTRTKASTCCGLRSNSLKPKAVQPPAGKPRRPPHRPKIPSDCQITPNLKAGQRPPRPRAAPPRKTTRNSRLFCGNRRRAAKDSSTEFRTYNLSHEYGSTKRILFGPCCRAICRRCNMPAAKPSIAPRITKTGDVPTQDRANTAGGRQCHFQTDRRQPCRPLHREGHGRTTSEVFRSSYPKL